MTPPCDVPRANKILPQPIVPVPGAFFILRVSRKYPPYLMLGPVIGMIPAIIPGFARHLLHLHNNFVIAPRLRQHSFNPGFP
jgi:hypothetical protein